MHAAETDVFPADRLIEIARKEVEYPAMPEVFLGAGVLLLDHFSCEGNAALAGFCLSELQKLLAGEVAGMGGHKVEKASFLLRVTETAEGFRVDGKDFHRAKILAVISWVSRTRRSLAWSCCRAKR